MNKFATRPRRNLLQSGAIRCAVRNVTKIHAPAPLPRVILVDSLDKSV
jgi:hypothetical protein